MAKPIDLKEKFPHLSKAPIVEAVLDIRVVPSVQWDETSLQAELKQRLPDFSKVEPSDYYKYPPEPLKELNWPLVGYLHYDVMRVPETPYSVNLIKTVQNVPGEIGLILDIDVFMQSQFKYDELRIIECLEEMRWVKNKIFFGSVTEKLIEELK